MKYIHQIAVALFVVCGLARVPLAMAACPLSVATWGNIAPYSGSLTGVVAIAAGGQHDLGLKADGTIVGWGQNDYGQATPPAGLSNVVAVSGGGYHSLAVKSDGTVVAWGADFQGQIDTPTNLTGVIAIAAGSYHSLALKSNGTVIGWGDNSLGQATPPTNLTGVVAIAAGGYHSLALLANGTLVGWGYTNLNVLTFPPNLTNVAAISAGLYHSLVLKSNGVVVSWGYDISGQIVTPTNLTGVVAIAAGSFHSLALKNDGTIVGWGDNSYEQSSSGGLAGVVAIGAGQYHSVALAPAPAAPSDLALRIVATNQLAVTWRDNFLGGAGFKIERAPDAGGLAGTWTNIAVVGAGVTNYTDGSVAIGATYWYRVRASNGCGDSVPCLPLTVIFQLPDAPLDLSATIGASNVVELVWYEFFVGVDGFTVQRAPDAGGIPGSWVDIGTTNPVDIYYGYYTDAGAAPNTTNWYRVVATNGIGASAYSDAASVMVVPPTVPTNLTTINFSNHVDLTWLPSSGGVTGFKIESAPDVAGSPGAWSEIATVAPAIVYQADYTDATVGINMVVWYRVRAFNWIGNSPYGSAVRVNIVPPAAPANLTVTNTFRNQLDLAWQASDATNIGFKIERAPNQGGSPGTWTQIADISAQWTGYADKGLDANHTWFYRVRAYNFVGDSLPSNEASTYVRDGQFVRVMQWNVERSLGRLANNGSGAAQAIARIVNYNQPDILLFNEIDTQGLSVALNQTAIINWVTNYVPYLGAQPGTTFYVAVSSQSDGFIRNAAVSRYPIVSATTYNDGLRGLHAFKVQLSASNALQVFHTHLKCCADDCTRKQTEAQFDANIISAFAATNSLPYIFAGDWNEEEEKVPPVCTLTGSYHPITTIRQGASLMDFKPTNLSGEYRTWSSQSTVPSIRFDYLYAATNRLAQPTGYVFSSRDWISHGLYDGYIDDSYFASDHYCVFANYFFPGSFQAWQAQYFGTAANPSAAPDADIDGDGFSNYQEFLAGTSPTNSLSALQITSVLRTNNDVRITWSTGGGRTNTVQAAASVSGNYSNLGPGLFIAGSGDKVTNYLDVGAATNLPGRYYRIRVAP